MPKGPIVYPLTRPKNPVLVDQKEPSTGLVGLFGALSAIGVGWIVLVGYLLVRALA